MREPFTIPRLDLQVEITLVPYREQERIEAEVFARMRDLQLEHSIVTEQAYDAARAVRWFAIAFLDPGTEQPIGTLADWEALDADIIASCWRRMADVREMHDPLAVALTEADTEEIAIAVKKKDLRLLRFFGVARLASYLATMADRPQISASPTSGASESSSES